MSLSGFHTVTARWFENTFARPTAAQLAGWRSIREGRHTLIAAPTGSGKTLAAFLTALDALFQEGLQGPLPDEVRVVYVSPLKALSADIHKNLALPRRAIAQKADMLGIEPPRITAAVRTGDSHSPLCGGCSGDSARAAYAVQSKTPHRNTVRNRLEAIEATLPGALDDPQIRVSAWIALLSLPTPAERGGA